MINQASVSALDLRDTRIGVVGDLFGEFGSIQASGNGVLGFVSVDSCMVSMSGDVISDLFPLVSSMIFYYPSGIGKGLSKITRGRPSQYFSISGEYQPHATLSEFETVWLRTLILWFLTHVKSLSKRKRWPTFRLPIDSMYYFMLLIISQRCIIYI